MTEDYAESLRAAGRSGRRQAATRPRSTTRSRSRSARQGRPRRPSASRGRWWRSAATARSFTSCSAAPTTSRATTAKALEELRAALSLDARVRLAHFYTGLDPLEDGQTRRGRARVRGRADAEPRGRAGQVSSRLTCCSRGRKPSGASALMREVIRDRPDFANARFELGNALLKRATCAARSRALKRGEARARRGPHSLSTRPRLHRRRPPGRGRAPARHLPAV